jgi:hypothetical protein
MSTSVEIKDYDGPEVSFGPGRTGDGLNVQIKRALAESAQNGNIKQLPVATADIDKIAGRIRNESKRSGYTVSIKTVGGTLLFKVTGSSQSGVDTGQTVTDVDQDEGPKSAPKRRR